MIDGDVLLEVENWNDYLTVCQIFIFAQTFANFCDFRPFRNSTLNWSMGLVFVAKASTFDKAYSFSRSNFL